MHSEKAEKNECALQICSKYLHKHPKWSRSTSGKCIAAHRDSAFTPSWACPILPQSSPPHSGPQLSVDGLDVLLSPESIHGKVYMEGGRETCPAPFQHPPPERAQCPWSRWLLQNSPDWQQTTCVKGQGLRTTCGSALQQFVKHSEIHILAHTLKQRMCAISHGKWGCFAATRLPLGL